MIGAPINNHNFYLHPSVMIKKVWDIVSEFNHFINEASRLLIKGCSFSHLS